MIRKRRLLRLLIAILLLVLVAMPVFTWNNTGNNLGNIVATFNSGLSGTGDAATFQANITQAATSSGSGSWGTPFATSVGG